jgi:hypothetical protein
MIFMNILNRNTSDADPFKQSDRKNPLGGGKGDASRIGDVARFRENFEEIDWGHGAATPPAESSAKPEGAV